MIIYGLMKFIEKIPERYDKTMAILSLGGRKKAQNFMLQKIWKNGRILDIGCGTGTFLIRAAKNGAICEGVDSAIPMLDVFKNRLSKENLKTQNRIRINNISASLLQKNFPPQSFDLIFCSFMLGELPELVQTSVLEQIPQLLKKGGKLIICDEFWPENPITSFLYKMFFAIAFVPNFILTRTMISPIKNIPSKLAKVGLKVLNRTKFAMGVVSVLEAEIL
ncbi:MAG: class I SAM-dependent methyltransferase [Candidatus Riflebacteria bacterium]|nr:class I SAM-dependent methyltransferase [Candidatus Riflebacteria bacterium]